MYDGDEEGALTLNKAGIILHIIGSVIFISCTAILVIAIVLNAIANARE